MKNHIIPQFIPNWIGGREQPAASGDTVPKLAPASGKTLTRAARSGSEDVDEAVRTARGQARPGDVVLLSPGCASFDHYGSYAERGEHFRRLVEDLA